MKPFDLQEYLKNPNRKIVTRVGLPVRIVCTDVDNERCVIGLVHIKTGELAFEYYSDGTHSYKSNSDLDLFFVSEKKEGWINLYDLRGKIICGGVYASEKAARGQIDPNISHITTIPIEWEE